MALVFVNSLRRWRNNVPSLFLFAKIFLRLFLLARLGRAFLILELTQELKLPLLRDLLPIGLEDPLLKHAGGENLEHATTLLHLLLVERAERSVGGRK